MAYIRITTRGGVTHSYRHRCCRESRLLWGSVDQMRPIAHGHCHSINAF